MVFLKLSLLPVEFITRPRVQYCMWLRRGLEVVESMGVQCGFVIGFGLINIVLPQHCLRTDFSRTLRLSHMFIF